MLYLAWDREINISFFFCDVFVWKWRPRPWTSSRCYNGNKSAATFKKGIFVHPPECLLHAKFEGGLKIFISQDVWFLQRLVLEIKEVCHSPFTILYSVFSITASNKIHWLVLINTKLRLKPCCYLYKSNTKSRLNSLLERFYAETNMRWNMA